MIPARELEWLRLVQGLRAQMLNAHDEAAAARAMLRPTRRMLGADTLALVTADAVGPCRMAFSVGASAAGVDPAVQAYLLRGEWPRPAKSRLLAPVERRGRRWAVLVADARKEFAAGEGQGLVLCAAVFAERLHEIDRRRASEVRARIDRKIMTQLRPQDLCYQILHGLRSLTGYDHSGAVYVIDGGAPRLRLAAEQVAWSKSKSNRIGVRVELRQEDVQALRAGDTCGFDWRDGAWRAWRGSASDTLALAFGLSPGAPVAGTGVQIPTAASTLLAPLVTGHELLGVIKLASAQPGSLAAYEADLLHRFLPQASVAIRNAEKTESLKESVLRAERKHAMADLARGVAHDVNNALGSVLPIVQQVQAELREGAIDPEALRVDLARIEDAVATCRRIFSGMLAFAKGAAGRGARYGDLRRAVDSAANILRTAATRRGVRFDLGLPEQLPAVAGAQHELEQLFLNLMSNACEAMPDGGELRVVVAPQPGPRASLQVRVVDTGHGMSREELARIEEAFYTTKGHGSGLGLAICRSIIGDIGGRMVIDSEPGAGTSVNLELPVLAGRAAEAGA